MVRKNNSKPKKKRVTGKIKNKVMVQSVRIRKSPLVFVGDVIIVNILLGLVVLVSLAVQLVFDVTIEDFFTAAISVSIGGIILVIEIVVLLSAVLRWTNEYYEITSNTISVKYGVFYKQRKDYMFRNILEVQMQKNFIGGIFKYGDIYIKTQLKEEDITLRNVINPERGVKLIKQICNITKEPIAILET